jgi:hypothetical protein
VTLHTGLAWVRMNGIHDLHKLGLQYGCFESVVIATFTVPQKGVDWTDTLAKWLLLNRISIIEHFRLPIKKSLLRWKRRDFWRLRKLEHGTLS